MATIILTGGGTAGHCTPHLALLPYLKKDFDKIYYIGSKNGIEKQIIKNAGIPYYSVDCVKLKRQFSLSNLKIPFTLYKGIKQSNSLIKMLKPDVIFSKGGYVALPTVIASKKHNIPVIAHESDYTIGLANKLSSRYCKKVLTSFQDTANNVKNGEYVGAPIRKSFFTVDKEKAIKEFGFSGKKPVLLVTGGSQGAKVINNALRNSLSELLYKFDIIHLCGKNNIRKDLTQSGYYQVEFLNEMEKALAVASVCVSRAGSNTVFELLCLKIPSLLIPLPKGLSRGDQVVNANYFKKLGLVSVLEQENLTSKSLLTAISSLYSNRLTYIKNLNDSNITDASRQISRILVDSIAPQ